jgi:hypothetical protein
MMIATTFIDGKIAADNAHKIMEQNIPNLKGSKDHAATVETRSFYDKMTPSKT